MKGEVIQNPHPAIILFHRCDSMKWNHLPVAGAIADQNPDLLEKFDYIFGKRAEFEKAESDRQKQEMQRASNKGRTRRPGRSR